jgi:protein-S-isoprenylcysteine O-methyltransferase Ste14
MERIPALIAAICLTVYWFWVLVKLVRLGLAIGKDPNALPREPVGQMMRLIWYPCVLVLLVGLWMTASRRPALISSGMQSPSDWIAWVWIPADSMWVVVGVATLICIACTVFTFVCWRRMGRSWRIGIDPGEKLEIVSTGPYRYVRHPIYALRMVINLCAFIMAPTMLVAIPAAVDFLLLQIEARREERYMESKHGPEYAKYKNSVGRFIPRPFVV